MFNYDMYPIDSVLNYTWIVLILEKPSFSILLFFCHTFLYRSKQQKASETENVESEEAKEGVAKSTYLSDPSPQPTQETTQAPAGEKSSTVEEKAKKKSQVDEVESEAKETTFVSPTEEEIKQLCETPKAGEAKKKE